MACALLWATARMTHDRPLDTFLARRWGEHRERGNLIAHALGHTLFATAITLLLAHLRVTVPSSVPLVGGAVITLGQVYVAALVIAFARVDLLSATLTGAVLVLATRVLPVNGVGLPLVCVALGWFLVRAGHRVYHDVRHEHLGRAGARDVIGRTLGGAPAFVLLALLAYGWRPALRGAIEARSRRLFTPQADRPWRNWAGTAECVAAAVWYPRAVEDLVEIVALARRERRRIRVVGAAFSWSPLVPTADFLVSLCLLNDVRLDLSDPGRPRAIVEAGANGRDLSRVLEPAGYAITSNVVMETVTWGGMVAVGAHGSGWDEQTLSDMVEAVELVDGTGAVRRFERGVDPDEVMNAVRVSLGLFGVVHRVTLRVVPAFRVRHEDLFLPMERVLAELPELVSTSDYLDLYWIPFNERVWVRRWNRTSARPTPRLPQGPWSGLSDRSHWGLWVSWLQTIALHPLDRLSRAVPAWTPAICRVKMALGQETTRVLHIHEATHFRSGIESYRVGCAEFAIAIDPAFESVRTAWQAITREVDAWAARGRYPLTMAANARFVRNSDCLLAPAHGNARTCYIEILGDHRGADWAPFVTAVAAEWMKLPNARAHWGKEYAFIPGIVAHTRAELGGDLARLLAVRDALGVDPDGLFVNDFVERLLLAEVPHSSAADGANP